MTIFKDLKGSYLISWQHILSFTAVHLIIRAIVAAILLPLGGFLLALSIGTSEQGALTDQDIARFLLTPAGFVGALAAISLFITGAVLDVSVMTVALRSGKRGIVETILLGVSIIRRRFVPLFVFSTLLVLRILLLSAPFVLVAGGVAYLLLTEFDINYYLTYRPPSFLIAGAIIAVVALLLGLLLLARLSGWAIALSLVLLKKSSPRSAFRDSAKLLFGQRKYVVLSILEWALTRMLLGAIVSVVMGALISWVPGLFGNHLGLVATATVLFLILWMTANSVVGSLCNGALAHVMNRFYVHTTGDASVPAERKHGASFPIWTVTLGAVAIAGTAFFLSSNLVDNAAEDQDVEVIAHRGAAGARPENTYEAIEKALEDKSDWVEIDVQENAEGVIVIAHDSDFMKLGGSPLKVWDSTMDDLAQIDIGSWFDPKYADQRTPTLEKVLAQVKGRGKLIIELKYYGHDVNLEERVAMLVEQADMVEDVAIMSLKYSGLQKMQALRPEWRTGVLAAKAIGDLTALKADFLAVNTGQVSAGLIKKAHDAGQQVYVWTVDDAVTMSRMVSMGVDGLITNEPALARKVLDARVELSPTERLALWLSDQFRVGRIDLIAAESDA